MAKPFSLQLLLDLMRDRTDEATRKLGQLIADETNARERLKLLENYRSEYLEKFRVAQADGLSPQAWQNYQAFIARLDEAVGQQLKIVSGAEQRTADGQQHWINENRQMKALDTLSQRHQVREQQVENKREQKLLDEFAARKHHDAQHE